MVVGVALHGLVAGALGTAALFWVSVDEGHRRRGIGRMLVDSVSGECERECARLMIAEVADGGEFEAPIALLRASGFEREGEIADYYRDGVALTLWRRSLR